MALVYKGHDLLLHRNVAVKVLRQQYVHDEEFIRRFRREAQSAASLSHPNVVSIYDVGQEDDIHYIVMEFVEGKTLNEVIKEKAPMQVEEALHIASQICDALEHAHSNHIIHRDIKPHNILIGKNGRVKVTDFGIARAITSSTITQTGSVVGSVHYFSPEHAKGVSTGEKSDLYSLGIVMYQMLTGKLPFLGESPISVALKHLQEDFEEPRQVNPLIPQSVENIIMKAMRKNPDERYQSATEMLRDLETALEPARLTEAKWTFADDHLDDQTTIIMPTIRTDEDGKEEGDKDKAKRKAKRRPWLAPVIWISIFVVFLSVMWFAVIPAFKASIFPEDVPVPDINGLTQEEAEQKLAEARLKAEIIPEYSTEVEKGRVIRHQPSGMNVKENSVVKVWVSQGSEMIELANYVNRMWKDVRLELAAMGLDVERQVQTREQYSDMPEDTIIIQNPKAGELFDPTKGIIEFTISKGREQILMPDVTNYTVNEAISKLESVGLKVAPGEAGIEYEPSFDVPKDRVIRTYPVEKDEYVDPGQEIKLTVSSGPPEDYGEMVISLSLESARPDKPSIFRIVLTDAQYKDHEYATFELTGSQIYNVRVKVTKDTSGYIEILRDNAYYDYRTITYQDYLHQVAPPKQTADPASAPTPEPSMDPMSGEEDEGEDLAHSH